MGEWRAGQWRARHAGSDQVGAGVAGRVGSGGMGCGPGRAGWGRVGGLWGGVAGQVSLLGVGMAGRVVVGRRVGWYGPVAESVCTARKGVCNGGVKNALQSG